MVTAVTSGRSGSAKVVEALHSKVSWQKHSTYSKGNTIMTSQDKIISASLHVTRKPGLWQRCMQRMAGPHLSDGPSKIDDTVSQNIDTEAQRCCSNRCTMRRMLYTSGVTPRWQSIGTSKQARHTESTCTALGKGYFRAGVCSVQPAVRYHKGCACIISQPLFSTKLLHSNRATPSIRNTEQAALISCRV